MVPNKPHSLVSPVDSGARFYHGFKASIFLLKMSVVVCVQRQPFGGDRDQRFPFDPAGSSEMG